MLEQIIRRQRLVRWAAAAVVLLVAAVVAAGAAALGPAPVQLAFYVVAGAIWYASWLVLSRWGRGARSRSSPLWRQALVYGSPRRVLGAIDAEVAAGRDVRVFGRTSVWCFWTTPDFVLLTTSWLVQANRAGLTIVRLDEILWVFRYDRRARGIWGLPVESHGFRVCVSAEEVEEFPVQDPEEEAVILDELLRRRPEALAGFDEEWRELLSKSAEWMAGEIERRRGEWQALDAGGRERWHAEQRRALDESAQFLSLRGRDQIHSALDTAALARKGRAPRDDGATLRLSSVITVEWSRFALVLIVWLGGSALAVLAIAVSASQGDVEETLIIGSVAAGGLVAAWAWFAWRHVRESSALRLGRLLRRQGSRRRVVSDIDTELRPPAPRWLRGTWPRSFMYPPPDFTAVTASWLVQMRPGHAALVRLAELAWVHKRVVPKLVWWVGDRYGFELAVRLRDGTAVKVRADDEAELGELLEELLERRPGLLTGWRGDCVALLEAGPAVLAASVDERERQFAALPPEKREVWLDESWDLFQRFVQNAE
jgi:hypothetical protein